MLTLGQLLLSVGAGIVTVAILAGALAHSTGVTMFGVLLLLLWFILFSAYLRNTATADTLGGIDKTAPPSPANSHA